MPRLASQKQPSRFRPRAAVNAGEFRSSAVKFFSCGRSVRIDETTEVDWHWRLRGIGACRRLQLQTGFRPVVLQPGKSEGSDCKQQDAEDEAE
jgi:hypothetical protein